MAWTGQTPVSYADFFDNEHSCLLGRLGTPDMPCEDLGLLWNMRYDGSPNFMNLMESWTRDTEEWKALMIYGFIRRSLGGEESPVISLSPGAAPCDGEFHVLDQGVELCTSHMDLIWDFGVEASVDLTCNRTIGATYDLLQSINAHKRTEWYPYVAHIQSFCVADVSMNIFIISFICVIGFMVIGFMAICGGDDAGRRPKQRPTEP